MFTAGAWWLDVTSRFRCVCRTPTLCWRRSLSSKGPGGSSPPPPLHSAPPSWRQSPEQPEDRATTWTSASCRMSSAVRMGLGLAAQVCSPALRLFLQRRRSPTTEQQVGALILWRSGLKLQSFLRTVASLWTAALWRPPQPGRCSAPLRQSSARRPRPSA